MADVDHLPLDGGPQTAVSTPRTESDDLLGTGVSTSSVESVMRSASTKKSRADVKDTIIQDQCCPVCLQTFPTTSNLPRSIAEHMAKKHVSQYRKLKAQNPMRFVWSVPSKSQNMSRKRSRASSHTDEEMTPQPRKRGRPRKHNEKLDDNVYSNVNQANSDSDSNTAVSRKRRCLDLIPAVGCETSIISSKEKSEKVLGSEEIPSSLSTPKVHELQPSPTGRLPIPTFISLKQKKAPRTYILSDIEPLHYADYKDVGAAQWLQPTKCTGGWNGKLRNRAAYECAACSSRAWHSGGCRFVNLRLFLDKVSAESPRYVLASEAQGAISAELYRPELSTAGGLEHSRYLLRRVAPSLRSILQTELAHEKNSQILRRSRIEHERPVCDGCSTTIFSGNWMCYVCARDLCLECYVEWNDSKIDVHKHLHLNLCKYKRGDVVKYHTKAQMIPYTRFQAGEIELLMSQIDEALEDPMKNDADEPIQRCHPDEGLPYAKAELENISLTIFQQHWSSGEPLVLSGFLARFGIDWTPAYFIEKYGDQETDLVDVIKREVFRSDIRTFFSGLQNGDTGSMSHLKLNDWPDVDDFATAMPDLFQDFEQALPFPIYTQRRGHLNLAAWFPPQYLPPDLGPKLYCAGPSSDAPGHHGTTVLHMDMTDAVNIMTWSGTRPSDRPGSAVWDIFPKGDADKLRRYLLAKVKSQTPNTLMDDPIRRAQFYLTTEDLEALRVREGVQSWRVYQNPGEAVFIPAGCAHQVCNLAPCIKVACDFVSPENVDRCADITRSDRRLAALAKREDVLQLKNLIYFAFSGVQGSLQDDTRKVEESSGATFDASLAASLKDNLDDGQIDSVDDVKGQEQEEEEGAAGERETGRIDDRAIGNAGLADLSRLTGVDQSDVTKSGVGDDDRHLKKQGDEIMSKTSL